MKRLVTKKTSIKDEGTVLIIKVFFWKAFKVRYSDLMSLAH